MNYYHYTKGCHLPSIVRDGIIETSKVLLEKHEKPAVWLTKNPEWEFAGNSHTSFVFHSKNYCLKRWNSFFWLLYMPAIQINTFC